MAIVRPFKAIRPATNLVQKVASLPYDVMNREEAKQMANANACSFLHVVRSEIDLPDEVDAYDKSVYQEAGKNLKNFIADQVMKKDDQARYYIYRQLMDGRVQTGIVACASIDEYLNNKIKKHEFTRPQKEVDRINNFDYCDANTAPIFLTYRKRDSITKIINEWIKFHKPENNFISDDDITHIVWVIDDDDVINNIQSEFQKVEFLYIADGHHRSASSAKVGIKRRESKPDYTGNEEFNYFMSVIFPDDDLFIMDYNRVVKDLNGHDEESFLKKVSQNFDIHKWEQNGPYKPSQKRTFGMCLSGSWYVLRAKAEIVNDNDPVERLDVSILQKNLLEPILGIDDPRTNNRIDFVGGIRGLSELENRVNSDMKVAFSMYPTTMDDLLDIADAGEVMPPKSTWFEPKLRSGLFVHDLESKL